MSSEQRPEVRADLDSVRVISGAKGMILCVVAGGQITMYQLPKDKFGTLLATAFEAYSAES